MWQKTLTSACPEPPEPLHRQLRTSSEDRDAGMELSPAREHSSTLRGDTGVSLHVSRRASGAGDSVSWLRAHPNGSAGVQEGTRGAQGCVCSDGPAGTAARLLSHGLAGGTCPRAALGGHKGPSPPCATCRVSARGDCPALGQGQPSHPRGSWVPSPPGLPVLGHLVLGV